MKKYAFLLLGLSLILIFLLSVPTRRASSTAPINLWSHTGSMSVSRYEHTATLLPSGKVLVAGGVNKIGGSALATAELYDSSRRT